MDGLEALSRQVVLMDAWNRNALLAGVPGVWQANTFCRLCGLQNLEVMADLGFRDGVPLTLLRCKECRLVQLGAVTASEEHDALDWQDEPVVWLREAAEARSELTVRVPYLVAILESGRPEEFNHERLLVFSLETLRTALAMADWIVYDCRQDGTYLEATACRAEGEGGSAAERAPSDALLALEASETPARDAAAWDSFRKRLAEKDSWSPKST